MATLIIRTSYNGPLPLAGDADARVRAKTLSPRELVQSFAGVDAVVVPIRTQVPLAYDAYSCVVYIDDGAGMDVDTRKLHTFRVRAEAITGLISLFKTHRRMLISDVKPALVTNTVMEANILGKGAKIV